MMRVACVHSFCGAGGLTHGLLSEGIPVVAGLMWMKLAGTLSKATTEHASSRKTSPS